MRSVLYSLLLSTAMLVSNLAIASTPASCSNCPTGAARFCDLCANTLVVCGTAPLTGCTGGALIVNGGEHVLGDFSADGLVNSNSEYQLLCKRILDERNRNLQVGWDSGKCENGALNTFVGASAGVSIVSGTGNVGVGVDALNALTTQSNNVAVGYLASADIANNTTAVGTQALQTNTADSACAFGYQAGQNNQDEHLTAFGFQALQNNVGASGFGGNSAFGYKALQANTVGVQNTALGNGALQSNIDGFANVAVGLNSMQNSTSTEVNVAVGNFTLSSITTNGQCNANTALGHLAMQSAGITGGIAARNTAVGIQAMQQFTHGNFNVAVGDFALAGGIATGPLDTTEGFYNVAVGKQSLQFNKGGNNVGVGSYALQANITGSFNTAVGDSALGVGITGSFNTSIGAESMEGIVSGDLNTVVGYFAGQFIDGNGNSVLGANADAGSNNYCLVLGYFGQADASNQFVLGSTGVGALTTSATAAAGVAGLTPTGPQTYLLVKLNGQHLKIPCYN